MKRTISVILCVAMMLSMFGAMMIPAAAARYANDIKEIIVNDFDVIENTHGYMTSREVWNPETEEYDLVDYYYYNALPDEITVVFTDNTTYTGDPDGVGDMLDIYAYPHTVISGAEQNWSVGGTYEVEYYLADPGERESARAKYNVTIVPSPVESVVVEPVTITKGTECYTDDSGDGVYTCYYATPKVVTVYWKEGGSDTYSWSEIYDEFGYESFFITTDQSYENQWDVGSHLVKLSVLGCATEFTLNIEDTPIRSISVEDVEIIENTNGHEAYAYIDEKEITYFEYYPSVQTFTVTFNNGREPWTGSQSEFYNEFDTWPSIITDQSYKNQWGIGTHTATFTLMGVSTDFKVTIIKSPVKSATIDDVEVVEDVDCYTDSWFDGENGEVEYKRYFYSINLNIEFNDGTVFTGSSYELRSKYGIDVLSEDDQGPGKEWGAGAHTVNAQIAGCKTSFTVTVVSNPIKAITVDPIDLIENADGHVSWSEPSYYYYSYNPDNITVELKDGTKISGEYYYVEEQLNSKYPGHWFDLTDDQSSDNPWGVGAHTASIEFLGVKANFTVNVAKTPVKSVSFEPVSLIENVDGYIDEDDGKFYYSMPALKYSVTLNDGTVLKSDEDGYIEYNNRIYGYRLSDYNFTASLGETKQIEATVMGFSGKVSATVKKNEYKSLALSGKDKMVLTFTKNDGSTEVHNVQDIYLHGMGYYDKECTILYASCNIVTDKHTFVGACCLFTDKLIYMSDLQVVLGTMKSNKTSECSMLRANVILNYGIVYDLMKLGYTDEKIAAMNGAITAANVDEIVAITVQNTYFDHTEKTEKGVNYDVYESDVFDKIKAQIKSLFGLDNFDLTKSSYYRDGKLYVPEIDWPKDLDSSKLISDFVFKDGKWILTASTDKLSMTATFDDKVQFKALSFTNKQAVEFKDVKKDAFYAEAVAWAVANDITNGTSDTTFSPNNKCTRGQVVTFLWRANGQPKAKNSKNPFTDVKAGAYYYDAVLWAVESGVTSGLTKTTFGPGKECTRGQVVTFLWRAKGSPAPKNTKHPFTDVKSDGFYYKAMLWAVENGVTNGTTATTFGPGKTCTRGQVVTFLHRAFK